ncbi:hypothetical protein BTA51_14190 [Hahella sp. CCB-MM4]|uniref:type III secretion system cytoplasmic ring protein SctQ n=1 Tax=Hahella sp. (strain CCB-MM4) TaxID=1926491 RepID=UPI000B9A2A4D|nr:type III secretion system cytoplasmic ring protein SctQ [Hahella sp. CCB-MM4]OZG72675.1 hypothetical protein BTA51_14190 [Hahella sp. CCB-MM4]
MTKALSLPQLSRVQVAICNLICSRKQAIAIDLPEHQIQLRLQSQEMITPYLRLAFYAEGRPGCVYLEERAVAALLGEDQDPSVYPPPLLAALVTSQLHAVMHGLSSMLETELEMDDIQRTDKLESNDLCIGFHLSKEAAVGRGFIKLPSNITEKVAGLIAELPVSPSTVPVQPPIVIQVLLSEMRLSCKDLNYLETGDVLMLPPDTSADQVTLRITGYGACRARLDDHKLVLVTPMTSQIQNISEHPDAPSDLGNIELTMEFHLGSLKLTLAELTELAEGTTLDLDLGLEAPVSAKINGQTVARCELVEIDGRLGVRIVRLTSATSGVSGND